jgi:hypothetical protein
MMILYEFIKCRNQKVPLCGIKGWVGWRLLTGNCQVPGVGDTFIIKNDKPVSGSFRIRIKGFRL